MQLNNRMQAGIRREADRDYGFCRLCVTTAEDLKGPGAEDEARLCQMLRTAYWFPIWQATVRYKSAIALQASTASIA